MGRIRNAARESFGRKDRVKRERKNPSSTPAQTCVSLAIIVAIIDVGCALRRAARTRTVNEREKEKYYTHTHKRRYSGVAGDCRRWKTAGGNGARPLR